MQKIFFTIAGTFVYLYMFLSVPGAFDLSFGNVTSHPALTIAIVLGGDRPPRRPRPDLLAGGEEALGEGQAGRRDPLAAAAVHVARLPPVLPQLDVRLVVTAIFLAAFALPVTFESVMWVTGSGSLANVASFTPGAIGVTQATNALALKTCCDVAKSQAVDYSTAQQLIVTAWNQLVAIVLVVGRLRLDRRQAARQRVLRAGQGEER